MAGRQINPIDVNFHLQKSLEFFDKNSADKIWFNNHKEIKVSLIMPIRVKSMYYVVSETKEQFTYLTFSNMFRWYSLSQNAVVFMLGYLLWEASASSLRPKFSNFVQKLGGLFSSIICQICFNMEKRLEMAKIMHTWPEGILRSKSNK